MRAVEDPVVAVETPDCEDAPERDDVLAVERAPDNDDDAPLPIGLPTTLVDAPEFEVEPLLTVAVDPLLTVWAKAGAAIKASAAVAASRACFTVVSLMGKEGGDSRRPL